MAKTDKNTKKKNKLYLTLLNGFVFIVTLLAIWFIFKNYLHINDDTYVNDAQVKAYINPINSRVPGYIEEIHFKEHQKVKKGDTLIVLDKTEFKNAIAQAEAGLSQAEAGKEATKSSVARVGSGENTVEANMLGVKAQLENARADLARYKNLLDNDAVTLQQYQQIETKVKTLESQYNALQKQKNTAQLSTSETQSQLGISDAQIEAAKASLNRAKLNLQYSVITAPEDGVMGRRSITRGQFIQPGQQIAALVQEDSKWIEANLLETQIPLINEGDIVYFTIDAMGDTEFEGKVNSISAATGSEYSAIPVDNSAGNFVKVQQRIPVKIEFTKENDQQLLEKVRVGMNVVMTLNEDK
ncbi:membrane fusion protein, multidrug efflux system [Salegentibacter holothuriorum]|uniref:Membrane fusion protein, multidrug efflux system n=1 Tax=Salegentibacter holothuriorum TaxID=241145 RepID=A0A1T5DIR4_9FLAO|nr:HlyD family secretion protein [Salegentibacter holothuriorum]SKB71585.1 membrane fusion protein, multidrug efflux system [Salegentibacter holothuriorum]